MAEPIQLTSQQQKAFDRITDFLEQPDQAFFILKGYAGTGKTTLLQHLAQHLKRKKASFALLVDIPDYTDPRSGHIDPSKNGFGSIIC